MNLSLNARFARSALSCALLVTAACAGRVEDGASEHELREYAAESAQLLTGNGAPSGAHYQVNIIGVSNPKSTNLSGGDGRRIFVPISGGAKILLSEGAFGVLDANGTDGSASFQLPSPDADNDGVTEYSVFARALGKPGGSSTTTTCATDPTTGELYCSVESMVLVRSTGKSSFTNVSKQLLYVYADIDGDGDVDRVPLFDSRLQDFYWQYDNQGLKVAQLRFYPMPTDVN